MTETQMFSSVLLIEDDSSHALLIKRALKSFVEEVRHCESVADGIAALEETAPALIVTDLNLPDSTNVEHVKRLGSRRFATTRSKRPSTTLNHRQPGEICSNPCTRVI